MQKPNFQSRRSLRYSKKSTIINVKLIVAIFIFAILLVNCLYFYGFLKYQSKISPSDAIAADNLSANEQFVKHQPRNEKVSPSDALANAIHSYKLRNEREDSVEQSPLENPFPSNVDEQSNIKPPRQFKTGFPGLGSDVSVSCGGHSAPNCSECPQGNGRGWCNGECIWKSDACVSNPKTAHLHPDYFKIIERYAFQPVMNQNSEYVNVIMVRAPFRGKDDEALYKFYEDDILFLGISSFESYPLNSCNPHSGGKHQPDYYLKMFPGFLHMMHEPKKHFPTEVKTVLMSQSDFMLDEAIRFGERHRNDEKIYDFVYSGGDQEVEKDCVGWASHNKNFSFVREALEIMCSPKYNVTGVLVANKNKAGTKACTIPKGCEGKIVQTSILDQNKFFGYLAKARWVFLPQICDASPRVSTQALSMNIPLLMNKNILGGWKYLLPGETGEFFHDRSDFEASLRKILDNTRGKTNPYKPLDFVTKNYGNANSGKRLLEFIKAHFSERVDLPEGTNALLPTGA